MQVFLLLLWTLIVVCVLPVIWIFVALIISTSYHPMENSMQLVCMILMLVGSIGLSWVGYVYIRHSSKTDTMRQEKILTLARQCGGIIKLRILLFILWIALVHVYLSQYSYHGVDWMEFGIDTLGIVIVYQLTAK